jgi:hypothetical protein
VSGSPHTRAGEGPRLWHARASRYKRARDCGERDGRVRRCVSLSHGARIEESIWIRKGGCMETKNYIVLCKDNFALT